MQWRLVSRQCVVVESDLGPDGFGRIAVRTLGRVAVRTLLLRWRYWCGPGMVVVDASSVGREGSVSIDGMLGRRGCR
jgi:hypothetical protein